MDANSFCKRNERFGHFEMEAGDGGQEFSDSLTSSADSGMSNLSSTSDFMEDATSSSSPSLSPPMSNSNTSVQIAEGPLFEMSSLMSQLPFKRGLSKHFEGKSQSFTSLAEATCLADLAKPENPHNKRLKSSRSYAAILDCHNRSYPPRGSISKPISRKSPKGSSASSLVRRNDFVGSSRPPVPTYRNI